MDRLCQGFSANIHQLNKLKDQEAKLLVKASSTLNPQELEIILEKYYQILSLIQEMEIILNKIIDY